MKVSKMKSFIKRLKQHLIMINENVSRIEGIKPLIFSDLVWCEIIFGSSPSDYRLFEFNKLSFHERKTFFTRRDSRTLIRKNFSSSECGAYTQKLSFLNTFTSMCKRKYSECASLTYEELEDMSVHGKIICKPISGEQGKGIIVCSINRQNMADIFKKVKELKNYLVEEWICQHAYMESLNPGSVNPVRVQTLITPGGVEIVGSTITLGNGKQFANASSGALFALVDPSTGGVVSNALEYESMQIFTHHPITGKAILEIKIPFWNEIISLVKKAALTTPEVVTIGWDVAIRADGPVLIEGNLGPGYTAMQLPVLTKKRTGNRDLFSHYLS